MYVDESGNTDLKAGRYYVISGIIMHQSKLDYIQNQISNYRSTKFKGKYTTTEIHIHKIWQGKKPFDDIDVNTKHFLLTELYQLISTLPFTAVSVVIDKLLMRSGNYVNWNATKASWTFITERFDMFVGDNDYNEKGMLIVDKNSRAVDEEIADRVNDLLIRGSEFHAYRHIFETPHFVTSKNRVGLEIADAVSFCTLKHYCLNSAFTKYWDLIEPRYRRNPNNNQFVGFGLKLFPS